MTETPAMPECPHCDYRLTCPNCNDTRPQAGELSHGWRLRTPLGRWETVERVVGTGYAYEQVLIYTVETGPEHPWPYQGHQRVDARSPETPIHGTPQVRIHESDFRFGPMYAFACNSGDRPGMHPSSGLLLVEANHVHGQWRLAYRPYPQDDVLFESHPGKAAARGALRAVAGDYARRLKVPLVNA